MLVIVVLALSFAAAPPAGPCEGFSCLERCDDNDGAACLVWASYVQRARGKDLNTLLAAPSLSKACRLGVVDACNTLAMAVAEGSGVPKNLVLAAGMLDASCSSANNEAACSALLLLKENADGPQPQALIAAKTKAAAWLHGACVSSSNTACSALVDAGDPRADELHRVLCARDDGIACLMAAARKTPPDEKLLLKAVPLLHTACKAKEDGASCYWLLRAVEADLRAAQSACALGFADGCEARANAAAMKAAELHGKKCEALDLDACEALDKAGALSASRARDVCVRTTGKRSGALCLTAARLGEWDMELLDEACTRRNAEACTRVSTNKAAADCVTGNPVACKTALAGGAPRADLSAPLVELCARHYGAEDCQALAEVQDSPVRAGLARKAMECRADRGACFADVRVRTLDDARFGCDLGAVAACEQGWALSSKSDADEALIEQGCHLGSIALCDAFAARAEGPARRQERLDLACSKGSVAGCRAAAAMACSGDGTEKDLQRCASFELKACRLGDRDGCAAYRSLIR